MFQAISARLIRLAQRARDRRLTQEQQIAAAHGWQLRRVAPGTCQFRDPRFDTLRARQDSCSSVQIGGGRDG
jgi:hypothetical protein